jgi:hypothetical protein
VPYKVFLVDVILQPNTRAKRITGGRRLRSKISIDSNVGQCHYRACQSIASVRSRGAAGRPRHRIAGNHFVALLLHFNPEAKGKLRATREESQECCIRRFVALRTPAVARLSRLSALPSALRSDSYQAMASPLR